MPTIRLKPNSAEFETNKPASPYQKTCDMPQCNQEGDFRAPRDRSLSNHYHFCQKHITEYNRAWNFFDGMNPKEVEEHVTQAFYGDRPTWKYREFTTMEEMLFTKMDDMYGESDDDTKGKKDKDHHERITDNPFIQGTPEMDAIIIMGLEPPLTLDEIKKEYKILAKKYHPDHNKNDPASEELLKQVNMAYTILKAAYGKYETLQQQNS